MEGLGFSLEADLSLGTLVEIKPRTTRELWEYIYTFCRNNYGEPLRLGHTAICPGHCAPIEFIADGFFERTLRQLLKANRGAGKTQAFGLLSWLELWFKGILPGLRGGGNHFPLDILNIGAVEGQALKCFDYTDKLSRQDEYSGYMGRRANLKTLIKGPEGSSLAITVATMNGVNSPHVPVLHIDELDLWSMTILKQALSIPQSFGPHRTRVRMTSTQKFAIGPMQTFLESAHSKGYKYYEYCIWESIETCPPERSCRDCPIFEWPDDQGGVLCGGKARHSTGHIRIDDFIQKVREMDRKTIEEEWLCLRPSREGLVFGREFNENYHVLKTEIPYSPELPLVITIDQGWTNPFAVLYIQDDVRNEQTRIIGEQYETGVMAEDMGERAAWDLWTLGVPFSNPVDVIYDNESPGEARAFARGLQRAIRDLRSVNTAKSGSSRPGATQDGGYKARLKAPFSDVVEGLRFCRTALKLIPGRAPFTVVGAGVRKFAWEFTQYHYPTNEGAGKSTKDRPTGERPVDKDNHAIDAWRRFLLWKNKRAKVATGGDIRNR